MIIMQINILLKVERVYLIFFGAFPWSVNLTKRQIVIVSSL